MQYAVGSNPPGVFPFASATGDLNGDGILDLVVANYTDGGGNGTASITVLLGNGDGTFTANNNFQAFDPTSLTLVDVDQDGILDLLVTRDGNNDMQVYHGVGDGTFTQLGYSINAGLFPINIGVADFDKDGIPDLVITSNSGGARFVHGNGDGTFGQYGNGTNFSTGNRSIGITVGDYNRDGNPDFIVTNAADGTVGVFLGDGTGNFASQVTYSVGNYPNSIANPTSLTIHAGSSGSSTLTFSPAGGYTGTFTVACNNLPANASCQFMQNGSSSNYQNNLRLSSGLVITFKAE